MKSYKLPRTSVGVSRIAYGCMGLGGHWSRDPLTGEDRSVARDAVYAALDSGINLFDHADIYQFGKAEEVFGEMLNADRSLRDRMVIQSKCGIRFADPEVPHAVKRYDFSAAHIIASVDAILGRLQCAYLDVLLLHRPDPLCEPEEVARAFDQLFASGKVRYFGVSNHTPGQIELLRKHIRQPIMFNQVQLSLVHHHLINEGIMANVSTTPAVPFWGTIDYCRAHDIRIQAWGSLAHGSPLAVNDRNSPLWHLSQVIGEMARQKGVSGEAIMLAWLLRHPAGIQPVIGTTNPQRIRACAAADTVEMSREEWYALLAAARNSDVP